MSEAITKQYHNTTDQVINVLGVGEIQPHDRITIVSAYPPAVVLENYPGLVEITALSPEDQVKHYSEHQLAGAEDVAKSTNKTTTPTQTAAPVDTNPTGGTV